MTRANSSLIGDLRADIEHILEYLKLNPTLRNVTWVVLACDSFAISTLFRTRQWCRRKGVPGVSRVLRALETGLFAIELGNDIELGRGVYFLHTVGTVVGGDAKIGDGCVFLGNITIGGEGSVTAPRIGARTVIGAGARVLGDIVVGENCMLGANAVVVDDVPAGKVVVGIPARVVGDNRPRSDEVGGDPSRRA
jgi:serine O-acetyltransferase